MRKQKHVDRIAMSDEKPKRKKKPKHVPQEDYELVSIAKGVRDKIESAVEGSDVRFQWKNLPISYSRIFISL